jgi:iron complex outermembrane receptor protein
MMAAETVSSARTWALSAEATLAPADAVGLIAGLDASRIARDATRTRDLASGASFTDRLWPAVSQLDLGAFAEGHVDLGGRTHLVAGGRGDLVRSAAAAADDPSLGGLTVREQYVRFYGEQAADTERDELVGGANLTVRQDLGEALFAALGLGAGARPANLTERAYAFSPAAAGFEVGDPSLRAERKLEAVLSVGATHERVALHAAAWAHRVDDLIRSAVVAQVDLDGDGALDAVRGFVPVDAALVGFELDATARLGGHWQIPVRLDATRGWERGTGAPLPEIPPLDATVGLRLDLGSTVPWFAEVNARGVARQQRVAAAFPEDPTEAFWTLGASAGVSLDGRLDLVVRGRNLLDAEYDEHLTRAAIADLGGLVKGQDIGAPGRAVDLSLRARF